MIEIPDWTTTWITNPDYTYYVAEGGRGAGGKSESICRLALIDGVRGVHRILAAREYQANISQSLYSVLKSVVYSDPFLNRFYTVSKTGIVGRNGTEIFFSGLRRNIGGVKSIAGITRVLVEEAQYISEESWETLIPTVIRNPGAKFYIAMNRRFETDATDIRFIQNTPQNCLHTKLTLDDNPWVSNEMYLERRLDYAKDPERADHVWGGEILRHSKTEILAGKCSVTEFTPGKDWDGPYYGIDWGASADPTTAVKVWRYNEAIYIEDEIYGFKVDDIPRFLLTLEGLSKHVSFADNSWPDTIRTCKVNGLPHIRPCVKGAGSVQEGINYLRARAKIVIHPRCTNTVREARLWRWKSDSAGNPLPEPKPGDDHTWDAIRYALQQHISHRTQATAQCA